MTESLYKSVLRSDGYWRKIDIVCRQFSRRIDAYRKFAHDYVSLMKSIHVNIIRILNGGAV